MNSIRALNDLSSGWSNHMLGSLLDTTGLLCLLSLLWWLLGKRLSAQFGYFLFLLVIVKAAIPVELIGPSWLAELSPRNRLQRLIETQPTIATDLNLESSTMTPATTVPVEISSSKPADQIALPVSSAKDDLLESELPPAILDSSPAATPMSFTQADRLSWRSWLMGIWGIGVLASLVRFVWIQISFRRRLKFAKEISSAKLPIDLAELQKIAGVRRRIRYFISSEISSPALWGIWKSCLLLPSDFTTTYSSGQMRWILLHEFAHIRRGDLWVALFQRLVQIAQFFNPAVWIANGMSNRLREYACDDAALAVAESSRRDCGDAFLRAVERANIRPQSLEPALGIFRPGRTFRRRLLRILDTERRIQSRLTHHSALILLVLAAIVLPSVRAAEELNSDTTPAAKAEESVKAPPEQPGSRFIALIPSGGTVELIGISEHPSNDGPWWRADGSPLAVAPYAEPGGKLGIVATDVGREIVFRFEGVPDETMQSLGIVMIGSGGSRGLSIPKDQNGNPITDLRVKMVSLDRKNQQAKFRVQIPTGDWIPVADHTGRGGSAMGRQLDGETIGVTFLPTRQNEGNISLDFAHNITKHEVRLVALDKDGKTKLKPSRQRGVGAGGFQQLSAEFNKLKFADIRGFQLEVRKLQYLTFDNVSIIPGHETDVTLESTASGWGAVSGQFLFNKEWPQPKLLVKQGDTSVKDAAISAAQNIYSEELLVDQKTKGVANVFVYLRKRPAKIHHELINPDREPLVFDAIDRRFQPHVMIARVGQSILAKNADPLASNVHTSPKSNKPINVTLAPNERTGFALTFNQPEAVPFQIKSDFHAWMNAYSLVLDHPYAAITDQHGKFTIKNLPAGRHEFIVWHEKFGILDKSLTVEVKNGKTTKLAPRKIGP